MKKILAADLFCGAGGASTGFIRACDEAGLDYELLAINHWTTAVKTHALNHPGVRHLCESLERVEPREQIPGGRLHVLLAGPECTHFSTARGGRPVNPQSRASAWHIAKWAQELYIDTILIENVPEFRTWGPVGADGKPLKSKKGETFAAFLNVLRSLGYKVEVKILNAADYGDPTTRQRLFIMARRGRHAIRWPEPTHSKSGSATLFGGRKRWTAARQVIDWSIKGKSIFNRKKSLRPATIARILAGLEKFGGEELKPFLVILRNNQSAQSIDGPVPTLTTSGANVGLAQPCMIAMEHGGRELDIDKPLPTITTAKGGAFGVAVPSVVDAEPEFIGARCQNKRCGFIMTVKPRGNKCPCCLKKLPAGFNPRGSGQPIVMPVTHGEDAGRVRPVDDPLPTVTGANRGELAVVEPFVISAGGAKLRQARGTSEPLPTVMGSDRLAVVDAFVLPQHGGGVLRPVDEPLPTIATKGAIAAVEPFLVPFYTERPNERHARSRSVDDPMPTITTSGGGKVGVVEPYLAKYYGSGDSVSPTSDPVPTVTTRDRFALVEPFVLQPGHAGSPDCPVQSLDEPLGTLPCSNRFALIQPIVNGMKLDIHFRMLQPHELAAAMSFPKTYQFTGTREEVVKQIGNSWAGELSKALCKAAVHDFAPAQRRKTKAIA